MLAECGRAKLAIRTPRNSAVGMNARNLRDDFKMPLLSPIRISSHAATHDATQEIVATRSGVSRSNRFLRPCQQTILARPRSVMEFAPRVITNVCRKPLTYLGLLARLL